MKSKNSQAINTSHFCALDEIKECNSLISCNLTTLNWGFLFEFLSYNKKKVELSKQEVEKIIGEEICGENSEFIEKTLDLTFSAQSIRNDIELLVYYSIFKFAGAIEEGLFCWAFNEDIFDFLIKNKDRFSLIKTEIIGRCSSPLAASLYFFIVANNLSETVRLRYKKWFQLLPIESKRSCQKTVCKEIEKAVMELNSIDNCPFTIEISKGLWKLSLKAIAK